MKIRRKIIMLLMPKIETVKQAKKIYYEYPYYSNSIKKDLALKRWDELFLPMMESAIATGDIDAFSRALESIAPFGKARQKAYEALTIILPKITTLE